MNWEDMLFPGMIMLVIAFSGLWIYSSINESRRWEQFKSTHDCKIVGEMKGDTLTTIVPSSNGSVGVGVTSTPDKKGWLCNDGVTYWR